VKSGTASSISELLPRLTRRVPSLISFVIIATLYLSGGLDLVENTLTQWRFQLTQRDASGDLVVVEIDPKSLQEIEIWPWPRGLYAVALKKLLAAGARRVAITVDFSSPSSPAEDKMLQGALANSNGKVILPVFKQLIENAESGRKLILSLPIPKFREHSQLAFINVQPETDGLIRRMMVRESWKKQEFPSLPFALTEDADIQFDSFFIDYAIRKDSIPRISMVDILRGTFDESTVSGKQVIIGATAVALGNQLAVPIHRVSSGTLIQALAYESLHQGRALLPIAHAPILIVMLLLALVLGPQFIAWSWRHGMIIVVVTCSSLFALSIGVQYFTPALIDITPWVLLISLTYGISLVRQIDHQGVRLMFQGIEILRKDTIMRNVVENSFDGIITTDAWGDVESINPAVLKLFGYSSENILGHHMSILFPEVSEEYEEEDLSGFLKIGKGSYEIDGRKATGEIFPLEVEVTEILMDKRRFFTAFIRDITERNNLKKDLQHHALHDTLTNLPNRSLFFDRLDQAIYTARRSQKSFAILLIDLDRFKGVNDTLGHHIGDLLLKQVGLRLQHHLRESDTIARLGGDEFVILFPETQNVEDACHLATKIIDTLKRPFQLKEYELEISASIGISVFPEHGTEAKILIQSADSAMYMAKHEHCGYMVYVAGKNQNRARRLMLIDDLRKAIKEKKLVLHYQPKLNLGNGQISGVEALVRWPTPNHGFLLPDEFIELAEQTGLIRPLTLLVLDQAISQSAKWHEDGFKLEVSVNLSAHCLQDLTFPEFIDEMISKWNLPAKYLSLEVTESAVMVDPVRALKAIKLLKGCGIRLSIDDFGTGYSSLAYLSSLSADELKIDKSFILNMNEDKINKIIVEATIALAHKLGMTVVAEGIECEEISKQLTDLGCDLGQGNLFSRPMASEDFEKWLRKSPQNIKLGSVESEVLANKLII